MRPFQEHFERCALLSLEKREKLLHLAGEHFLELDPDTGIARFQERLSLPFQVLGTESDNTLTWLWAWADEQTEMPEPLTRSSRDLRTWFEAQGMHELIRPSVDLNLADGTQIAVIATEVSGAGAFYRDIYEGGSLFILLLGNEISLQPDLDRPALVRALGDLASRYEIDHRHVLTSYFRSKGLPLSEDAGTVNAQLANGERVIAEFGPGGRALLINGEPFA